MLREGPRLPTIAEIYAQKEQIKATKVKSLPDRARYKYFF
jgi:hypothetical protein